MVLPSTVEVNGKALDYNEGLIPASSSPSLKSADMHGMYPSNVQHPTNNTLTDYEEQVEFKDESIDNISEKSRMICRS